MPTGFMVNGRCLVRKQGKQRERTGGSNRGPHLTAMSEQTRPELCDHLSNDFGFCLAFGRRWLSGRLCADATRPLRTLQLPASEDTAKRLFRFSDAAAALAARAHDALRLEHHLLRRDKIEPHFLRSCCAVLDAKEVRFDEAAPRDRLLAVVSSRRSRLAREDETGA